MQVLYVAAFASVCVLFGTVFFVMRSVRDDEDTEMMDAETGLSFMGTAEDNAASAQNWREAAAALAMPEPEEMAAEPVVQSALPQLQPVFAQGFAAEPPQLGVKRSRPPLYALVLQGMVVGAAIVLLTQTQTQKRMLRIDS